MIFILNMLLFISFNIQASDQKHPDYETAKKFQTALKDNDRNTIAKMMKYPIDRELLKPINTPEEFLENWDDYFNEKNVPGLISAKASEYGWRGVALEGGSVWFENGTIKRLNLATEIQRQKHEAARENEKKNIHKSLQGYDSIEHECSTDKLRVRIQRIKDSAQYFAWKKGASLSSKPDLALNGTLEVQGTGGNTLYSFSNGPYTYQLFKINLCGEDCNNYLTVFKNKKEIMKKICNN